MENEHVRDPAVLRGGAPRVDGRTDGVPRVDGRNAARTDGTPRVDGTLKKKTKVISFVQRGQLHPQGSDTRCLDGGGNILIIINIMNMKGGFFIVATALLLLT